MASLAKEHWPFLMDVLLIADRVLQSLEEETFLDILAARLADGESSQLGFLSSIHGIERTRYPFSYKEQNIGAR